MRLPVYLTLIFLCSFLRLTAQDQDNGIRFFQGSLDDLKIQAKLQNKAFFIDCYTSWCGPCHKMSTDVFTQKEVGDFFNENFIAIKLDMEHGEGRRVAEKYDVGVYPTYLFFNADGELLHRTAGYKSGPAFIRDGKQAIDPQNSLYALIKRYKSGERDTAFLKRLISAANVDNRDICEAALENYWEAIPESDYIKESNWAIFNYIEQDINTRAYTYIAAHKDEFEQKYSASAVNNALLLKANASIERAAQNKDETTFKKAKAIILASENESVITQAEYYEILFYKNTGRWEDFIRSADAYIIKNNSDYTLYNAFAQDILSAGVKDKKILKKALSYAGQSVTRHKTYQNTATYAEALYRNGKLKEAEAAANECISLCKREDMDYSDMTKLIEKIRKK